MKAIFAVMKLKSFLTVMCAAAPPSLGVTVAPTGSARAEGRRVTFRIIDGEIISPTAAGTIDHGGGLRLLAGGEVHHAERLRCPRVGKRIRLSAEVGGDRVTILNLTGTPRVSRRGFGTEVRGLTARLTKAAAQALNSTFGVHAFRKGLALGRIRVSAVPSEAELRKTGATTVALDAGTCPQAIVGLGVTPGIIGPATLEGTTAVFPATGRQGEPRPGRRPCQPLRRDLPDPRARRSSGWRTSTSASARRRSSSPRSTAARPRSRSSTSTCPARPSTCPAAPSPSATSRSSSPRAPPTR